MVLLCPRKAQGKCHYDLSVTNDIKSDRPSRILEMDIVDYKKSLTAVTIPYKTQYAWFPLHRTGADANKLPLILNQTRSQGRSLRHHQHF